MTTQGGTELLVQQLRDWIETPKINAILLERKIFGMIDLAKIHEDLDQYNPRGLAMITQRLLSNRCVRRRILALAPERKAARVAMDALREWADVASGIDPQGKGN